jgi:hypothetical protein
MALASALLAMVLIGALIAGTFFATTQEYRTARNSLSSQRALTAAEYGPNLLVRDWLLAWNQTMKVGDTLSRIYTPTSGGKDTVMLTRLRFNMFYAVSTGRVGTLREVEARRRTGLLIRLNVPTMPFPGAFSGKSSSAIAGNFKASGTDSIPAGWTDCPPAGAQMPAVASTATTNVPTPSGLCSSLSCLTGTPKIAATPDAGDSLKIFDGWDALVAQANVTYNMAVSSTLSSMAPAYNANGTCNTTPQTNWGDPARNATPGACESYFPIVYIASVVKGALGPTTTIAGGSVGQGILLIDGNVALSGSFVWVGPIIVRGNVAMSGTGNKTVGGIQAYNQGCVLSPCNSLSGTSQATYSSCTISKILALKVYPTLAKQHAWSDLF